MIYDRFASEYGYTIKQFMSLTMRQVYALLEVIEIRLHNEFANHAALQGRKVKRKEKESDEEMDLSQDEKDQIKAITKLATQRKALEKWQTKTP